MHVQKLNNGPATCTHVHGHYVCVFVQFIHLYINMHIIQILMNCWADFFDVSNI